MNITDKTKHIGILGGSFDPIHYGHLKPVLATAKQLALTQVLLMPAHIPAHKKSLIASPDQRAAMVGLACKENELLQLDARELQRNSTSYTITTLKEIKVSISELSQLYFFIGMDSLLTFSTWYQHTEILNLCHLVVNSRPNFNLATANKRTKTLLANHQINSIEQLKQQEVGGIYIATPDEHNISSTQIRHNLQHGINCDQLIPKAVYDYITKQQLYLS